MPAKWDEARFFSEYTRLMGPRDAEIAREIYLWAQERPLYWAPARSGDRPRFCVGYGETEEERIGFVVPGKREWDEPRPPKGVPPGGAFYFDIRAIRSVQPFSDPVRYQEFVDHVTTIPGWEVATAHYIVRFNKQGFPWETVRRQLRAVMRWTVSEIQRAQTGTSLDADDHHKR